MLTFFTSTVGMMAIAGYVYVGVMFGRASVKAGNGWMRAAWDAAIWPLMGWVAIENLYKA